MSAFFLARQPIYDRQLNVAGYELLFRGSDSDRAEFLDGDRATSQVIVNSIFDIGLEQVVGDHPAYINITESFLDGSLPLPERKDQIVLELLEHIEPSRKVISCVERLSRSGYRFALDDFEFRPEYHPLLQLVDIVKLDVKALGKMGVEIQVERLRQYEVQLLAEKVETYEALEWCQDLGFDSFQGFFFCRPKLLQMNRPDANRLVVLELMAKLQDTNSEYEEISSLISCDAALSYRLLRYVNSAYFGVRTEEVTSIQHMVLLTGLDKIRQWGILLLMTRLLEGKPAELITLGLVRAKMCGLVGAFDTGHHSDEYFTVGLFSILDALMDQSLEDIVTELALSDETKSALIHLEGPLGVVLKDVLEYEREPFSIKGVDDPAQTYLQAISWTNEMLRGFAI